MAEKLSAHYRKDYDGRPFPPGGSFNRAFEKLKEATEDMGEDCSRGNFQRRPETVSGRSSLHIVGGRKTADKYEVFVRRLTSREAAELLGISDRAVRMRQERILRKLRAEIERLENENGG